jgi:hypothetical protein
MHKTQNTKGFEAMKLKNIKPAKRLLLEEFRVNRFAPELKNRRQSLRQTAG